MNKRKKPKPRTFAQRLALPTAGLLLVLAGTSSVVNLAGPPGTRSADAFAAGTPPAGARLEALCGQYWGSLNLDGSVCRFEQIYHVNMSHAGRETLVTPIPLVPGDTVSLQTVSAPQVIVGAANYGRLNDLVSSSAGYLSFRASPKLSLFSVQQVRVQRCFGSVKGAVKPVACPRSGAST